MRSKWTWRRAALALTMAFAAACTNQDQADPNDMGDRPNGAACERAGQCATGVCNAGVCQSTSSGTGRANGSTCGANVECGSGYCVSGVCQSLPGGIAQPNGTPCTANNECASMICAAGVCQSRPGSMGAPNGRPCGGATDCASGYCAGGACQGTPGAMGRPDGAMCANNSECASANCTVGVCRAPTGGGRPNGGACANAAECMSGFCVANVCQSTPTGTGRPNGATCSAPGECASANCTAGVCTATPPTTGRPNGTACDAPAQCASNVCVMGVCRANDPLDGGGNMDATADRTDARTDRPDSGTPDSDLMPDSSVPGEICRNGFDDNGNGQVDEGCQCYVGQRQFCYVGNPAHAGVATCTWGTQMCTGAGGAQSVGTWTACMGYGRPGTETCDMMDNDCDRMVDEDCRCTAGATRPCFAGPPGTLNVGVCRAGAQSCLPSGTWGACNEQFLPVIERCDRIDNDCDGMIDEGCNCRVGETRSCYNGPPGSAGMGICTGGQQQCRVNPDGTSDWGACVGARVPEPTELCDGRDNNCNGRIDENCPCTPGMTRSCFNGPPDAPGVGICRAGAITCLSSGMWSECRGAVPPTAEACNGRDDDCDGEVDGDWCVCREGQTLTYHRRNFDSVSPRSMIAVGDGRPTLLPMCEPMRCPVGQVAVEVSRNMFRCVAPPPSCPPELYPYYTQGGEWRCERGCEVYIIYGHLYDGLTVCGPRPDVTCPAGQTPHYAFESEVWECRPMCDNGQYDIHMIGSRVVCIPC